MVFKNKISNDERISALKNLLLEKRILRFLEVHNGLSGLIAENAKVAIEERETKKDLEFDGFWESSFTDSASKGLPDIEIVSLDSRLNNINQIMEVTKKPMIVDGDTGGEVNQFEYMVKKLERAGASMVIIEDKVFPKRNSLESGAKQDLENPELFAEKIRQGQLIKKNPDFMIAARIESLIAGLGQGEAIKRAEIYLKAGADAILIHSKSETPDEILEFAKNFYALPEELRKDKWLCCVPTTYNMVLEDELEKAGFHIVIYANHLLRASYLAMKKTASEILKSGRAFEADPLCCSVKEIFEQVGFLDIKEKDRLFAEKFSSKIKVIIPAAGKDFLSEKYQCPRPLLDVAGKTILERQIEPFRLAGLSNFVVIKGYRGEMFKMENVVYCNNADYEKNFVVSSLFCARDYLNSSFIFLYADVLFQESIVRNLIKAAESGNEDIILVVDSSLQHHKDRLNRDLDLVITKNKSQFLARKLVDMAEEEVSSIGEKIDKTTADCEFIGLAYFSSKGAEILKEVYDDSVKKYQGKRFHEAESVERANFTDLIQEIVDRGYSVKVLKVYQGWMEIENDDDLELARKVCVNS